MIMSKAFSQTFLEVYCFERAQTVLRDHKNLHVYELHVDSVHVAQWEGSAIRMHEYRSLEATWPTESSALYCYLTSARFYKKGKAPAYLGKRKSKCGSNWHSSRLHGIVYI